MTKEFTVRAGTVLHYNGIPIEVKQDFIAFGDEALCIENAIEPSQAGEAESASAQS